MNLPEQGAGGFEKTPEQLAAYNAAMPKNGSYFAKIFKFVYSGTKDGEYQGVANVQKKCSITFEFVGQPLFTFNAEKGPQPWTVRQELTYSTSEKSNLFKMLMNVNSHDEAVKNQIISGQYDPANLIGKTVVIAITQVISKKAQKPYLKVVDVSSPVAGQDITVILNAPIINPVVVFDIDALVARDPQARAEFNKLYSGERKDIAEKSHEFRNNNLRLEDFEDKKEALQQGAYIQPATGAQPQQQGQPMQQNMYQQPNPGQGVQGGGPDKADLPF